MRMAVAHCSHESNMFSPRRSTLQMFQDHEYLWGDDLIARYQGTSTYLGGILDEARDRGIEVVPTIGIRMSPAPMIEAAAFESISRDFMAAFQNLGQVDAICVAMHGAMAAENELDPEGHLLSALRARFPARVPIAVTLDIHANISPAMLAAADGLFGSKVYPEIDSYDRGREAVAFLASVVRGAVQPVKAHRYLPMLAQKQHTAEDPARSLMELCRAQEMGDVLNCTLYFGYPDADVPFLGTHVVALANGSRADAEAAAERVATAMWSRREQFFGDYPSPEEAIGRALAHGGRPVIIAEASDNPGGGSYGDATSLLRAMVERAGDVHPAAFAFITDPETVGQAWEAGIGGRFAARIGGKSADACSPVLEAEVEVKLLTDGHYRLSGPMRRGTHVQMGRTALLNVSGIDVIIASNEQPTQVLDPEPFRLHGIEPARCRVVGLKSHVHFRGAYEPIASLIIASKGNGPYGPSRRRYTRLSQPLWSPS